MTTTKIEWADRVWNPVTGCTKVSEGCRHCYAEVMAKRTFGRLYPTVTRVEPPWRDEVTGATCPSEHCPMCSGEACARHSHGPCDCDVLDRHSTTYERRFTDVMTHPDRLDAPLRWRKPCRVFVNSMSDLFHEAVPDEFIAAVFGVMAACPQHTFLVLTKRPERMRSHSAWLAELVTRTRAVFPDDPDGWIARHLVTNRARHYGAPSSVQAHGETWPLPNVWLGVSVEDQATADARIPLLLQTPAAVRGVSCEPLLGPVDMTSVGTTSDSDPGYSALELREDDEGDLVETLDWVVIGGESGPKARPCRVEWIESVIDQCKSANVACFMKQLGTNPVWAGAKSVPIAPSRGKNSNPSEWPADLRVRQFPEPQP